MLVLALLLLQAPAAPPQEIVVVGERLKRLRFSAKVDKRGQVRCKIKRSSGDRAFDGIVCHAVHDCAARELRTAAAVEACIDERLKARFQALKEKE